MRITRDRLQEIIDEEVDRRVLEGALDSAVSIDKVFTRHDVDVLRRLVEGRGVTRSERLSLDSLLGVVLGDKWRKR